MAAGTANPISAILTPSRHSQTRQKCAARINLFGESEAVPLEICATNPDCCQYEPRGQPLVGTLGRLAKVCYAGVLQHLCGPHPLRKWQALDNVSGLLPLHERSPRELQACGPYAWTKHCSHIPSELLMTGQRDPSFLRPLPHPPCQFANEETFGGS